MTERPYENRLRYLESPRMRLVAATAELVSSDLVGGQALAQALEATVPSNWPPELYDHKAMEYALRQLRDPSEKGWSLWYLLSRRSVPQELIGICGFKGRPDVTGSVEIGYSILSQFRNHGLATEATSRLVDWAFGFGTVKEVCAETMPYLKSSIRVLEKNGFSFTGQGSEQGVIRYALQKSSLS